MKNLQATLMVRGVFVRQGCSLSPLFVICMQVLSKLMEKAAVAKIIGYRPYHQDNSLTHLCFADDVLVFSVGKKSSISCILLSLVRA